MSRTASTSRRALILHRTACDRNDIERLVQAHGLDIVYTVVTDTVPALAALIAVHHLLESDAEVVVVPHLTEDEVRRYRSWILVTALAELVTTAGVVERELFDPGDAVGGAPPGNL